VFLAGMLPDIRPYTVYIYGSGQHYTYTVYIRYFWQGIYTYTVIYGVYIRFWPPLLTCYRTGARAPTSCTVCQCCPYGLIFINVAMLVLHRQRQLQHLCTCARRSWVISLSRATGVLILCWPHFVTMPVLHLCTCTDTHTHTQTHTHIIWVIIPS